MACVLEIARLIAAGVALAAAMLALVAPAFAAQCGGSTKASSPRCRAMRWRRASASRLSAPRSPGFRPTRRVLAFDRRQHGMFHSKSFEDYARTRVIPARINRAKKLMAQHADLLSRIEQQYGVPRELIMAIWTMETDNGTGDMGKLPVIRTLSTLAWDCRRTDLFQGELIAALKMCSAAICRCGI